MKNYRVRRPKEYDELLNLMRDKEFGVFATLKSALVFSASVGFKEGIKREFSESAEPIAFTLFNEHHDQPFVYVMALTAFNDVKYLREDFFSETIRLFEEYAAGGLEYLDDYLDKSNMKESIEVLLSDTESNGLIDDLAADW
ncbi:DNA phosphorothioation-associated protein 4 [Pseudomonadales bacterium]|nr:DNA phosphorothioation-associated protein 4 [Pseudomonadales bacterium]